MMGNFLTTLGAEPADDRAMFEELGLNVARQPDNGANPRPDNRSGWLEGETPETPIDELIDSQDEAPLLGSLDPAAGGQEGEEAAVLPDARGVTDVAERLDELRERGLYRRLRLIEGPQGPRVTLDGRPVLLLCSNNYLGLADHPQVREAAAEAAMRWGAGAGRLAADLGQHGAPPASSSGGSPTSRATRRRSLFGSGYLANTGAIAALAGAGEVVFSDELNHASIIDGCRLSRAETFVYRHGDLEHLAWGLREARRAGRADRHRRRLLDGRRRRPAARSCWSWPARHGCRLMVDEAHATGAVGPGGRGSVADAGLSGEVDVVVGTLGKALGSYGAYVCADAETVDCLVNTARPFIFSTAPPPPAIGAAARGAGDARSRAGAGRAAAGERGDAARARSPREGLDASARSQTQIVPVEVGDAEPTMELCERAAASAASSPRGSGRRPCPRAPRACASR